MMKKVFVRLGLFCLQLTLKLRYRVKYVGLGRIRKAIESRGRGALFLPNHPAIVVDPMIVGIPLISAFSVRPLMVEYMYFNPLFHWAMRTIKALPIPDFTTGVNSIKLKRADKKLETIAEGLRSGDSFLIYPAGTTKQTGREIIGGAFGVHHLLSQDLDVVVVLVRTTGLWGSLFSRASTSGEPVQSKNVIKKVLWDLLKNALFFMPRRDVIVEFELAPEDFPMKSSKQVLNQYLERWYNKPFAELPGGGEPIKLVSYSFWKDDLLVIKEKPEEKVDLKNVAPEIQECILEKLAHMAKRPKETITPELRLMQDLGLDSLDGAELITFLEDRFDVTTVVPSDLTTVGKLFLIAAFPPEKKVVEELPRNLMSWQKAVADEPLTIPEGSTIPEVFLKRCDGHLFEIACADARSGVLSVLKCKRAILTLARRIEKIPQERIGILLPASSGAFIIILACQLAGKTPVMINWTVGGRHLDTVVEVSKIQTVLTSWTFLDNLDTIDLTRIEGLLLIIEEWRSGFTLWDLLIGSIQAFLPSYLLLQLHRFAHLKNAEKKEAVVLFTSGTESAPKGVPLTHYNILENHRAVLEKLKLSRTYSLLSILPPFHSFGFSITGLLPLLARLRVLFYPNPTESKRLATAINKWQVSMLCSAPTFLKNICLAGREGSFSSVRCVISGAEKLSDETYALIHAHCPNARVCEGYGITECSPVLTINTSGNRANGVGIAVPGVSVSIIHPETHESIDTGVGLILVHGPNVFSGYLNPGLASPFIMRDGKTWYNTGDLGRLDEQANLFIAGRYKRFVKIGGEMISLSAIEEVFQREFPSEVSEGVQFAVGAFGEDKGAPRLVLFTTRKLVPLEANQLLRKKGFGNLVKIDEIFSLDTIPLTGTGKVAYQVLNTLIK